MAKIYQMFVKVLFNQIIPCLFLAGNEHDPCHENIVNTYLFYQTCVQNA